MLLWVKEPSSPPEPLTATVIVESFSTDGVATMFWKPVDDPSTPDVDESLNTHSVSQQSYDNLADNFSELITLLKTKENEYKPNEDDVKIATLETRLQAMQTANNAANIAPAALPRELELLRKPPESPRRPEKPAGKGG